MEKRTNPYNGKALDEFMRIFNEARKLRALLSLPEPFDKVVIPSNQPRKNRHICPNCKNFWRCKSEECESDGSYHECPMCSARRYDCNPYTRVSYPGAFAEWEKSVK